MGDMQSLQILEAFQKGLIPDRRAGRNLPLLAECLAAKPTEFALSVIDAPQWPFTDLDLDEVLDWPYPQLFRGKRHTLLCAKTDIYEVTEQRDQNGDLDWQAGTALTVYKLANPQTESVTDGVFSSAKGTNWDEQTTNYWTIANGRASITNHSSMLFQSKAKQAVSLVNNHLYRVRYTITVTQGSVRMSLGVYFHDTDPNVGTYHTQSGTYVQDLKAGVVSNVGPINIEASNFTGTVDDVSVMEIAESTIPAGTGPWHFADFEDTWFLTNGVCLISRQYLYGRWTVYRWINEWDLDLIPQTVCNFQNRLLIGGINPDYFSYESNPTNYGRWLELWDAWMKHKPQDLMSDETLTFGSSWLFYSDLAGGDYYWPFAVEAAIFGLPYDHTDELQPYYLDKIKLGSIGFIPMPWQGTVRAVRPLGQIAVVYGAGGVTALVPQSESGLAIYRRDSVVDVGVLSRGAVGGDHRRQLFLDLARTVWGVTPDGGAQRYGYGEFTANLEADNVIITHDPDLWDFHISDGVIGLVKTPTGCGQTEVFPTHLSYIEEGLIGAYSPTTGATNAFSIITTPFDMGLRGLKTIKAVEIAATDVTDLMVCVDYRFNRDVEFNRSLGVLATQEGFCFPIQSGTDFRLVVTGIWGPAGKIDYITVRWALDDRRSVGGRLGGYKTRVPD